MSALLLCFVSGCVTGCVGFWLGRKIYWHVKANRFNFRVRAPRRRFRFRRPRHRLSFGEKSYRTALYDSRLARLFEKLDERTAD